MIFCNYVYNIFKSLYIKNKFKIQFKDLYFRSFYLELLAYKKFIFN